ncbi:MAG TPA: ABC-F family ATP-binding cassette domain-containing protein [Candidatus Limnocylindria bacterium]|nr:ABC-F family ATP-binding cassette domain-containing protein [Candidatus Limnocylindria bacterium]
MTVLSVQAVTKRFADRVVFSDVSLRLARGERAGLVGPNGTGKTTLLRIAAGQDEPDAGTVAVARGTRIGLLRQELLGDVEGTVIEHARGAAAHLRELERAMRDLEPALASGDADVLERYADLQHHFDHAGGYAFDATVERVLGGLGLAPLADREARTLSGGERTRLGLARLLLDDPDVLLLDEPTNHLDIAGLEWLEKFLVEREATMLVSSHDRWFLDRVTARTFSFERGTVVEYRGAYSSYVRQRADREAATAKLAEQQATRIAREEAFIARYKAGQRSKEARGRLKKLSRLERIQGPERSAPQTWRLDAAHLAGDVVVSTTALAVGHGVRTVLRTPALRVERGWRIAVAGPNGSGKTTLVRTLVGDLPPLDGYVSSAPTARVAFLAQAQAELTGDESVVDSLRSATGLDEQDARGLLARFLFRGEDVLRSVGVLSGGERTRLALARLAAREANLLVLDEPTNHLDVSSREQLETVLDDYEGTILFVSHDRYFIDRLATHVWVVRDGALTAYEGDWSALQRGEAHEMRSGPPAMSEEPDLSARRDVRQAGGTPKRGSSVRRAERPATEATSPAGRVSASPARRTQRRASAPRKVTGLRALEVRIEAMELQLKQLEERLAQVAQSGNYMETRIAGEEHAALERSLRALYDEWSAAAEEQE